MDKTLETRLTKLGNEVQAAAVPDEFKQTAAWCLGQLPALYAKLGQTSESRYVEEIARLVRGVLGRLITNQATCPGAMSLASRITNRFRLLHEQFGIPPLNLKSFGASSAHSRKAD
jgi:hypothetical protein